jgi:hypothetical protein
MGQVQMRDYRLSVAGWTRLGVNAPAHLPDLGAAELGEARDLAKSYGVSVSTISRLAA